MSVANVFRPSPLKPASAESTRVSSIRKTLQAFGLKPTRPRLVLGELLFMNGDRHVTAENLHDEVRNKGVHVSLATIYNTLHQFETVGLLRQVAIFGGRVWFDTTTGPHCHYYDEDTSEVFDIPLDAMAQTPMVTAPEGMEVIGVDIVVRVQRKKA
jgi:Fur family iron response transcriptional regulator